MQVRSSQIGHEDVVAVGIAVPAEMLDFVLALVARPVESRIEWIIGDKLIQSEDAGSWLRPFFSNIRLSTPSPRTP